MENKPEFKIETVYLPLVDSTNSYLKREGDGFFEKKPSIDFFVVYADEQTAGRGQRGNKWSSNAGENLLMSIMTRPHFLAVKKQFHLSQVVALSVKKALGEFGVEASLKWPNDIYCGKQKIVGILIEVDISMKSLYNAIIGIGVNVNQTEFEQMQRNPGSISGLTGKRYDCIDVLNAIMRNFCYYYSLLRNGQEEKIAKQYEAALIGFGQELSYRDETGEFKGIITTIESDGHIVIEDNNNISRRYAFKEVEMMI